MHILIGQNELQARDKVVHALKHNHLPAHVQQEGNVAIVCAVKLFHGAASALQGSPRNVAFVLGARNISPPYEPRRARRNCREQARAAHRPLFDFAFQKEVHPARLRVQL
jgi:hypothetical protein